MTKAEYISAFTAELEDLEARIADFTNPKGSINEFMRRDCQLRRMRKRAQALRNALASLA